MKFRYDENPNTLEFWDDVYANRKVERKNAWLFPEVMKLLSKYPQLSTALEIGCGGGRTTIELWKLKKSILWTGTDFSNTGIARANKKYHQARWACVDICAAAIPELTTYDFILCSETLEHLTKPMVACEHMWKMLRTAGTILITVPLAGTKLDNNSKNYHHVTFQPDDFGTMFPNELANVTTYQIDKHHLGAVIRKELKV